MAMEQPPFTDSVPRASLTARRVVMISIGTSLFMLIAMLGERMLFLRQHEEESGRIADAEQVAEEILLLDERLSMSAHMAASNGERAWRQRYEANIPLMQAALSKAHTLARADVEQSFHGTTCRANEQLLTLEQRAFERINAADLAGAQGILNSRDYLTHKQELAQGTEHFLSGLKHEVEQARNQTQQDSWLRFTAMLNIALLVFVFLWRHLNRRLAAADKLLLATQSEVARLALHDTLTGLPNRRRLQMQLNSQLTAARRTPNTRFAVMVLDLDKFKPINDRYGHPAGDKVLREVAQRLQACVRSDEMVARLGGDEFVVLIRRQDEAAEAPRQVAERIINALGEAFHLPQASPRIGTSIGIACYPDDGSDGDTLLRRADIALYRAKAGGRGQWRFFDADMDREVIRRATIEHDLAQAISENLIQPFFQPVVELASDHIISLELLARWQHPGLGELSPGEFIPIAENSGHIAALTLSLLCQALTLAQTWPTRPDIAFKLSSQLLRDPHFIEHLASVQRETSFPPSRLEAELNEQAVIDEPALSRQRLGELKDLGLKTALCNFGSGYSVLFQLPELPLDRIKIDRSFVRIMASHPENESVVLAILALTNNLGLQATAEGIETAADRQTLMRLGCHAGQGFLYAGPQPAASIPGMLSNEPWLMRA